jgi:hypothetical protein
MVGSYQDWIIANAKFLYGPHQTYDVIFGNEYDEDVKQRVTTVHLVAWDAGDETGKILRKNKTSSSLWMAH